MIKKITKSDLKNRMVVELRNHLFYMVIDKWLIGMSDSIDLRIYSKDLLYRSDRYDIIKVYEPVNRFDGFIRQPIDSHITATESCMTLLWKRQETKEVTMAEVEAKFGCRVKIIND